MIPQSIVDFSTGRASHRQLNSKVDLSLAKPIQTFFVPLPERDVFFSALRKIQSGKDSNGNYLVSGRMVSMLSVAVSTDGTVIFYDHWEDGYENDATNPKSRNTEVWGDGDASNGCRPDVTCSDAADVLNAGDSFVIESKIDTDRTKSNWFNKGGIKIDGGDRLQVNFPVTITRGEYAEKPGSLLAGAVEVHDESKWGTEYEAPVGTDFVVDTQAFQYVRLFIMSGSDDNIVTLPDGSTTKLDMGDATSFDVMMGSKVKSTKPLQVDILTGDPGSTYEMRWFSLLPTTLWSDSYVAAVGDTVARTKVLMYNPSSSSITATIKHIDTDGSTKTTTVTLPSKTSTYSHIIPTGSGALVESTGNAFSALSVTDTEKYTDHASGGVEQLNGQCYDWGYPLQPTNQLTAQVLVGWGYGCTGNECHSKTERSAVWVTPVQNADVYIDYQNTGTNPQKIEVDALRSVMIRDTTDHDMSGAIIFAVERGQSPATGTPVDFASAWGQDPAVSRSYQSISLDLGTAVLPFPTVRANKVVDKKEAAPGDILTYTISVQNVGQTVIKAGKYHITDPIPPAGEYVEGSLQYSTDGGKSFFAVDVSNIDVGSTSFPLDEGGFPSQDDLPRRGGTHQLKYQLRVVESKVSSLKFINTGFVTRPFGSDVSFEASTDLFFDPIIALDNKVYLGDNGDAGCSGASENVTDISGAGVTYCFTVKNTGTTDLDSVEIQNAELSIAPGSMPIGKLAVGESKLLTFKSSITQSLKNVAKVEATPVYTNGNAIPNKPKTRAEDPSEVLMIEFEPSIQVENTLYKGLSGTAGCSDSVEKVVGVSGTDVTHCFKITNTGNTFLSSVKLVNNDLGFNNDNLIDLAPGASTTISTTGTITGNAENIATATGTPSMSDGSPITSLAPVEDSDPAELGMVVVADTRSGTKDRPITCMQNAWEDAGNSDSLICRSKEVYLSKWVNPPSLTCNEGETITISLKGVIHLNSDRSDPGWYVAKDGGDALTGTCSAQAFLSDKTYSGVDVSYADGDKCGDVAVGPGGGAVEVPFIENQTIKCVDDNNDYNLDFSVCFSWRTDETDGKCAITRADSDGVEIDLFPASTDKCFCTRYDVDTIKVVKPQSNDSQSVC